MELNGIAGESGQVVEQAAEVVYGVSLCGAAGGGFALGAVNEGTWVPGRRASAAFSGSSSANKSGAQARLHVDIGEHAQEHVGAAPVGSIGRDVQVGFEAAEGALDRGQAFVTVAAIEPQARKCPVSPLEDGEGFAWYWKVVSVMLVLKCLAILKRPRTRPRRSPMVLWPRTPVLGVGSPGTLST